jgi:hypothetical protein
MKRAAASVVVTIVVLFAAEVITSAPAWAKDSNFGGYAAPVVGSVSADITLPAASTFSCTSPSTDSVDVWASLTRGEYPANAGVIVECVKGAPVTFVAGAAGTGSFRFSVAPGDVVSVSMSETTSGTKVSAIDTTSGVNATLSYLGTSTGPTVAQFGATSTSKVLPHFGTVTYSSCTVDGSPLTSAEATTRKLVRSHPPVEVPGPISGGSFTLTQ